MHKTDLSYIMRAEHTVQLLSGKWTVRILCSMRDGPIRLGELMRMYPPASKKALTASLCSLEGFEVIVRRDLSTAVLHVEYEFKEAAKEWLTALLDCLSQSCKRSQLPWEVQPRG